VATVVSFWDALAARDWDAVASFFRPDSLYYDVPIGPGAAGRGPASIVARLQLGLAGLSGYEHLPDRVITANGDGWVMTEHTEVWTWDDDHRVALPFVSVQRVVDGVITRWRDHWDQQTLLQAAPPAWHERLATADLSWVHDATGEF
jgi:limonene-1,2-epoxide hydrolase